MYVCVCVCVCIYIYIYIYYIYIYTQEKYSYTVKRHFDGSTVFKQSRETTANQLMLVTSAAAAAAAKSLQSSPTLCDPRDGSPPGSPVPGILQARTLEWVAIFFYNAWKWKAKGKSLSRVWLLVTPWTAAYQAPPSMGFSRQEYWSGVPLPSWSPLLWISKRKETKVLR